MLEGFDEDMAGLVRKEEEGVAEIDFNVEVVVVVVVEEVAETKFVREFETSDDVKVEVEFDAGRDDEPVGVITTNAVAEVEVDEAEVKDEADILVDTEDEERVIGLEAELNSA